MPPDVVEVSVEPDGEGCLHVRWQLEGGDATVDVATGPTPEATEHVHRLMAPAHERAVRLTGLGPGRHYVSLKSHGGGGTVAAERRVPFEGVTNFRDLGGYRTTSGARTRWGSVFRADALHKLTAADKATYAGLGLRAVYDLRGDAERATNPDPFPATALSIIGHREEDVAPADRSGMHAREHGEEMLRDVYVGMLANAGPLFGQLLTGLTDAGALPAVFHCTGGKDRTGMAAALLLELLGVARTDVLDDYELTSQYRRREHQTASFESLLTLGMTAEAAAGVLGTPRWAMADALETLDTQHGGIERYLTERAAIAPMVIEVLRNRLVR